MSVEPKALWTEVDFDQMGWHDSRVHGFSFNPPSAAGWSLALDIGHIDQQAFSLDERGGVSFATVGYREPRHRRSSRQRSR